MAKDYYHPTQQQTANTRNQRIMGVPVAKLLTVVSVFSILGLALFWHTSAASASAVGAITNSNSKCLTNSNGSTSKNNSVTLNSCSGATSQQWTVADDGTIQVQGKCMEPYSQSKSTGTKIVIYNCNTNRPGQKWTVNSNKTITNTNSKLCLDNKNGSSTEGNPIIQSTCGTATSQQWTVPVAAPPSCTGTPTGTFPTDQCAPPNLSMIPATATKTATLDMNTGDWSQWGNVYGYCPPITNFWVDRSILRTSTSVASAHYMVSGICNPIQGSGGVSRRSEHSSKVQDVFQYEGDERYYYLSVKPAATMPTPLYNYFIVSQWHPEGDGSPALSLNINKAGTMDIGESHTPGLTLGPLRKGVWTDYVLHVKFSRSTATGFVEGWENGVQTVPRTGFAALTDNSDWMKQGIYTSPNEGSTVHEVWFDGTTVWKP